eukprot:8931333-Lingulodinium_polyedra.AAC.1
MPWASRRVARPSTSPSWVQADGRVSPGSECCSPPSRWMRTPGSRDAGPPHGKPVGARAGTRSCNRC